jgi:hypothetical protein
MAIAAAGSDVAGPALGRGYQAYRNWRVALFNGIQVKIRDQQPGRPSARVSG